MDSRAADRKRLCRRSFWATLFCSALILNGPAWLQNSARASAFDAGVLEIGGSTSFSVDYQKEGGKDREMSHLRITPSIGYFIMDGLEASLEFSYILQTIHQSPGTDDRSRQLLFTLGPLYHFRNMSDVFVPYVGGGLGAYYQKYSTPDVSRSAVQFAVGLEGGTRILFTENVALKLGFQYLHGFKEESIGHTDFVGLEIGLSIFIPTWPSR